MRVELAMVKPRRQPVIWKDFESEKNSMAMSRAPEISKMLGAT